jgi:hypothetical protein
MLATVWRIEALQMAAAERDSTALTVRRDIDGSEI